eukprot:TRINITY_DN7942_c0_g1_i10.p1 TRINITY_DN7942_c0_g1~~TRINITY_DN7942_c0_g1_i10.p1  ORF type:complete len:297 (-),score=66.29 TRINITY_DN7942_c0_g1_i10:115-1005(-)
MSSSSSFPSSLASTSSNSTLLANGSGASVSASMLSSVIPGEKPEHTDMSSASSSSSSFPSLQHLIHANQIQLNQVQAQSQPQPQPQQPPSLNNISSFHANSSPLSIITSLDTIQPGPPPFTRSYSLPGASPTFSRSMMDPESLLASVNSHSHSNPHGDFAWLLEQEVQDDQEVVDVLMIPTELGYPAFDARAQIRGFYVEMYSSSVMYRSLHVVTNGRYSYYPLPASSPHRDLCEQDLTDILGCSPSDLMSRYALEKQTPASSSLVLSLEDSVTHAKLKEAIILFLHNQQSQNFFN